MNSCSVFAGVLAETTSTRDVVPTATMGAKSLIGS
jgi:hypothetical protein